MKTMLFAVLVLSSLGFSAPRFVTYGLDSLNNPFMASGARTEAYLYNDLDSAIGIPRIDLEILSPGLEESWFLYFYPGTAGSDSGKQRVTSTAGVSKVDARQKFLMTENALNAKPWSKICSDYGYYPNHTSTPCTISAANAIKNTAKDGDTLNARFIIYWYNRDNPRRDSARTILYDSTFLPCRLQYERGPTASDLTANLKRRRTQEAGVLAVAHGWQVPAGGHWTLRNLEGREIPLRQESTNDGVLLLPQGLRGVGVLMDPNGQSSKVHSLGGN
jgi:hypothetical protein